MATFNKVRGWIGSLFALDIDGPQLGRNGTEERIKILDSGQTVTTAAVDGTANAAYANVAGADPVADQDFVTKSFADTNYSAAAASKSIEIIYQTVGSGGADANTGGTKDSTATVPAGSRVDMVKVDVIAAFDGTSPTITVGGTTTPTLYQAAVDNKADKIGVYEAPQYTNGPSEVGRVVVSNAAGTVGHCRVLIFYSTPAT